MVRELDLDADIVAGKSAAGFYIGMDVSEMGSVVDDCKKVNYLPGVSELNANDSVLLSQEVGGKGFAIFFGNDDVRLVFNAAGKLYCIFLFGGGRYNYLGTYHGSIGLGSPLSKVAELHALCWDEGDEMHYIVGGEGEIVPGIAFFGSCASLEDDPDQCVAGFCIHDWSLAE